MNSKLLMLPVLTGAACCSCVPKTPQQHKKPNILYIMTDDHTRQAISAYGSKLVKTPNLDRIANEGILFDNAFVVNSISGPSRACILTGKFSHTNGFKNNWDKFDGDQQTYPKILQKNGYTTAVIGKWHLKSKPQGFDYWSILNSASQQGDYYKPEFWENDNKIIEDGYVTDVITDKAINFLDNRDKSKPFLLIYQHKAPHRNWMPAPRHLGIFNNTIFPEPETLFDDYSGRGRAAKEQDMSIEHTLLNHWDLKLATRDEIMKLPEQDGFRRAYMRMPDSVKDKWDRVYAQRIDEYRNKKMNREEMIRWKYQQYMRDYLATCLSVDENVGRIMKYLEEKGELDNTIIVYTADQGFYLGEHGWFDKRFMYEESHHMPLMIRYPKLIDKGSKTDALVMNVDFAPTLLDIAGIKVPEDMQGESFKNILENKGKTSDNWRENVYYHYYEYPAEHSVKRHYGIRGKRYKLIHFYDDIDEWELYDLEKDPKEMKNVFDEPSYAQVKKKMLEDLKETRIKYNDTSK